MTASARVEVKSGPHILVRALWYLLIGWWLTGLAMGLAWFLGVIVIGLPISFYLINRVPTMLTLRPRRELYQIVTGADGIARYGRIETEKSSVLVRAVSFVLVGLADLDREQLRPDGQPDRPDITYLIGSSTGG